VHDDLQASSLTHALRAHSLLAIGELPFIAQTEEAMLACEHGD
jgi:hypothetical protein